MNQLIDQKKCSDYNKGNSSSQIGIFTIIRFSSCLLYTSDAADE
mgnify:CR=1 FL=1